jgi:hypothetical protein
MTRGARTRLGEWIALLSLALSASCGRSTLYGFESDAGESGDGPDGTGGTSAGRGGRSGKGTGGNPGKGGNAAAGSASAGRTGEGGTDTSTGGSFAEGGTGISGGFAGNVTTGGTSTAGSAAGGTDSGGLGGNSGNGGDAGSPQAGKAGEAGMPNTPGVRCGDTICDARETCCVGLTEFGCVPAGSECNGAVLTCSQPGDCESGGFCCLTMGMGMATGECSDTCTTEFGTGRIKLRLCASQDDCTDNRECRMTFVGVTACMRRF